MALCNSILIIIPTCVFYFHVHVKINHVYVQKNPYVSYFAIIQRLHLAFFGGCMYCSLTASIYHPIMSQFHVSSYLLSGLCIILERHASVTRCLASVIHVPSHVSHVHVNCS